MQNKIKNAIQLNKDGSVKYVNPLIKLACINLIRKGKAEKISFGKEIKYIQNPILVIEEALSILNTACKYKKLDKLKEYYETEKV